MLGPKCDGCGKRMSRRAEWLFFPGRRGTRTVSWVCRNPLCPRHVKRLLLLSPGDLLPRLPGELPDLPAVRDVPQLVTEQ
jgi:hypothetical protein